MVLVLQLLVLISVLGGHDLGLVQLHGQSVILTLSGVKLLLMTIEVTLRSGKKNCS